MAFTATEQALLDFARSSLPKWLFDSARPEEMVSAFAKVFGGVAEDVKGLIDETFIVRAEGIFLDQHARDRGTSRQGGELDPLLRLRIRQVEDAVSRPAILSAAQEIIDAAAIIGTVVMVELRRDKGFLGVFTSDSGTGGTFTGPNTNGEMFFEPDAGYVGPPFTQIEPDFSWRLVISGAAFGQNNGTFPVTGLALDSAKYDNPPGGAAVDPGVSWTVEKLDQDGNLADGFTRAFFGRGYRMSSQPPNAFILILPFGCSAATSASIQEMLRQKKAAGVLGLVECRLSP